MANIIQIENFNKKELDVYARLNEAQLQHYFEPDGGIFIAESPKTIERALDFGCEPISILMEDKHVETQGKSIIERCPDVPVYVARFEVISQLTGFNLTRGALCAMKRPVLKPMNEICRETRRIAVLEDIVNPTNIGAIFRSAAALNIDAILLTPNCCDPLSRRSIRVSMGTVFQIPWTYIGDKKNKMWPDEGMDVLHELGFKTVAMALTDDSVSVDDKKLLSEDKLAIVLGTEGEGLCAKTIDGCDYTAKIPMSHNVDSLNVAAASAVAFWELGKRI